MWISRCARRSGAPPCGCAACLCPHVNARVNVWARTAVRACCPSSLPFPSPRLATSRRRRRQKENQEDLLQRVNQATLAMLNKGGSGGLGGSGQGRRITDIQAYKSVNDMQHNNTLTVQVDHKSECVLAPIYGVLVPFHILTIKNASNNQVRVAARACDLLQLAVALEAEAAPPPQKTVWCRTGRMPTSASTSTLGQPLSRASSTHAPSS